MVSFKKGLAVAALSAPLLVTAHPGEHVSTLTIKRQAELANLIAARGAEKLARCAGSVNARALRQRAIARRAAKVEHKRRVKRSSTETEAYDVSHNYTGSVSSDDVYSTNTSCILEPQLTIGPYWVSGEYIRQNVVEDQEGVAMELELQFIDVNTCEAVSDLYIDIWNANATGIYSGIKESSLDSTYLRGIQITDDDGVVTFDTLVPGHYDGRAVHTHVMVHQDVTVYSNNTITGGTVRSISQLFYDTEFKAAVEATEPYSSNTNSVTTNEEDTLLSAITLGDYDPFIKYIYLGSGLDDGIFAWHSIGIDMSKNYTSNENAASAYTADGGVDESSSGSAPGGSSGGSFNGTMSSNSTGSAPGSGSPPGASGTAVSMTGSTGTAVTVVGTASGSSSSSTTASVATYSSGAMANKIGSFWSKAKSSRSVERPTQKPSHVTGANHQATNLRPDASVHQKIGASPSDLPEPAHSRSRVQSGAQPRDVVMPSEVPSDLPTHPAQPSGPAPSGPALSDSIPSGPVPSGSIPSGPVPSGSIPSGSIRPAGPRPSGQPSSLHTDLPSGLLPRNASRSEVASDREVSTDLLAMPSGAPPSESPMDAPAALPTGVRPSEGPHGAKPSGKPSGFKTIVGAPSAVGEEQPPMDSSFPGHQ